MKKVKIEFLGHFDGKAIDFPFLDVKIQKNENWNIGYLEGKAVAFPFWT